MSKTNDLHTVLVRTFQRMNGKSSDYVSHYSCQWKKFVVTFNLVFLAYRQEKCHDKFFPFVYMF